MVLSIKFTPKKIYIAEQSTGSGGVRVYKTLQTDMPEGSYQKGVIINTTEVAAKIREVLRDNAVRTKRAAMSLNGVDMIQKEFLIPYANEKQTRGMIENELKKSDLLKNEYLFDYVCHQNAEQKKEGMQNVNTYLVPRQLVQNYMQTLQRAGLIPVKLKPLNDSMDKIVKALRLQERDSITILAYVEATGAEVCMTGKGEKNVYRSIQLDEEEFFEENIFILSAKQGISQTIDQEQKILDSLTETISKLVQFQSQRNKNSVVAEILLYGDMAQNSNFVEKVGELSNILTNTCEIPDHYLRYVGKNCDLNYNYDMVALEWSRLLGEKKELSFVKQFNEQKSGYITAKDQIPVFIMGGLAGVVLLAGITFKILDLKNQAEIKTNEEQIEQIITSDQYNQNLRNVRLVEEYASYNAICNEYIRILEETSRFESKLLTSIDRLKPDEIQIISYQYENKTIIVNCKSSNQDGPAIFAEVVTNAGIFPAVEYTGFQLENDIEGADYYRFLLKCQVE